MKLYKSYNFRNKDPIIDELRTAIADEGCSYAEVAEWSGVTTQTLRNWFSGPTKRPQFATVMAVVRGMGLDFKLVRSNVVRFKSAGK